MSPDPVRDAYYRLLWWTIGAIAVLVAVFVIGFSIVSESNEDSDREDRIDRLTCQMAEDEGVDMPECDE